MVAVDFFARFNRAAIYKSKAMSSQE